MRGCGTRGQMQTDERPHIAVLRAAMDQSAVSETEARYTFGVADKPEVLEVYPHKTSFREAGHIPEFPQISIFHLHVG